MDMVKVDPKLFVTCRLCLEEMGMYQITPLVQSQIKFSFDIDVSQFDGLPQLICSTCEGVLSEYCTKKRIFQGRQNALKARLEVQRDIAASAAPQQDAVSSSQTNDIENGDKRKTVLLKRPSYRESSISSISDNLSSTSHRSQVYKKKSLKRPHKSTKKLWEASYQKSYVCRLCQKQLTHRSNCTNHMKKHANLLTQHEEILKKPCLVPLEKIDHKPNVTGDSSVVVINQFKIIKQQKKGNCFVLYVPKKERNVENGNSENSDSDFDIKRPGNNKRRRLLSKSSTDTVILTDQNEKRMADSVEECESVEAPQEQQETNSDVECINIDDSSNCSSIRSMPLRNNDAVAVAEITVTDEVAIQKLVMGSYQKYIAKQQKSNKHFMKTCSSMKHKILSMGLKNVTNQHVPCTGLLRYMECNNLPIKWLPISYSGAVSGNPVRVMPKLKSTETSEDAGWKKIEGESNSKHETNNFHNISANKPIPMKNQNETPKDASFINKEVTIEKSTNKMLITQEYNLFSEDQHQDRDKKLLNANPVANPKQLPKKCTPMETTVYIQTGEMSNRQQDSIHYNYNNKSEDQQLQREPCMPIITSTTSLAVPASRLEDTDTKNPENVISGPDNSKTTDKPAPRIKVKPASELMSERVLKSLNQSQSQPQETVSFQVSVLPKIQSTMSLATSVQPSTPNQCIEFELPAMNSDETTGGQQNNNGTVVLDTVEFPNTRTQSPFKYLKNLLKVHNIDLLDYQEKVPPSVVLLIKFRLQFLRDANQPVTLSLSVYYGTNSFLLHVKDSNDVNIDINKLSANWQWEILKIYTVREDIIKRMLKNATTLSMAAFEYTKIFLFLLKSINFKTQTQT